MFCSLYPFDFSSDFDSGNLCKVKCHPTSDLCGSASTLFGLQNPVDYHLQLWTKPDGCLENPSKNRTWFHFSVTHCLGLDATALMEIMNLNRVQKLFRQGLRPLFRYEGHQTWRRVPVRPVTKYSNDCMELSFQFVFQPMHKKVYFAYCLPYSYQKLQDYLLGLEKRFLHRDETVISQIPSLSPLSNIYFHRCVLAKSFEKNNLDLLTISSVDELDHGYESCPFPLFPKLGSTPRKFTMRTKKFFFITSRVHPGETISSFMLDGLIEFLLSSDQRAVLLRKYFVFKIIPMLNPDGVKRGNYRGDHVGMNLNRVYHAPDATLHPTIYATKAYITYTMSLGSIGFYIDLHGHANKSNSFVFGNWFTESAHQRDILLFAKYCCINNPLFSIDECEFGPFQGIPSQTPGSEIENAKEGTSRVAISKLTSCSLVFTFEANYYGYKSNNSTKRFSLGDMMMMGKSILLAAFDITFAKHSLASKVIDTEMREWVEKETLRLNQKAVSFSSKF